MTDSDNTMSAFAKAIMEQKYSHELGDGTKETWENIAYRVSKHVMKSVNAPKSMVTDIKQLIAERKFMPGGRYLYASGRPKHQTQNCLLLRAEDSREGWSTLMQKATMALMTGAGIGVDYSDVRAEGKIIRKTGGFATGPTALMQMINEAGRGIMQGGSRRSAIWAGLNWKHADIHKFINMKNWISEVKALKEKNFDFPATMDGTNISVLLDDDFFKAFHDDKHPLHSNSHSVYWAVIEQMLKTAEPGFSVDVGKNNGETLRNACTEVTSRDDSDICNLGSINMARIETLEEMETAVNLATAFLLAGTVYSDVPYTEVDRIRTKNRRLGLGLMGIHEWLLLHGKPYGPDNDLQAYLEVYERSTKIAAEWSEKWEISKPVKTRAIAPTGCQVPSTLIVTEDGILTLGELGNINGDTWQKLNLTVSQEIGNQKLATRYFVNGIAETIKFNLSSGTNLECTPNHQYRVISNYQYVWKRADEMKLGDLMVVALDTYHKTEDIKLIPIRKHYRTEQVHQMPLELTPDLCRFLGIFFGDGSMHKKGIRIACNAKETDYLEVARLGEQLFGLAPSFYDNGRNCMSVGFESSMLLRWLYTNQLDKPESKYMEIPAIIRCSSRKSLEAFLDGYLFADGHGKKGMEVIDTASEKMAHQLISIIRSLGNDASIKICRSGMGSTMYRVSRVKTRRKVETKQIKKILKDLGLFNCTVDSIINISSGKEMTVDLEVPETTTYIANGIVSHNTIGIVAETTTGIEPIFCSSYKRRYKKGSDMTAYQYVLDPTAKKLVDRGVDPEKIEDAYSLAENIERRVSFQAWVQKYVDHAISSTINLPSWGSELNNAGKVHEFGNMLIKYLPQLRGITVYPDGARGGQPLTPIKYSTAAKHAGEVFIEQVDVCDITKGGSCGS